MSNFNAPPIDPGSGTFGRRQSARHVGVAGGHESTVKGYMVGFVLSIVLTAIPFAMVMFPSLSHGTILAGILTMAVIQVIVHVLYFLHLDGSLQQRWNVVAFAFTLMIALIVVSGSVWIMFHATSNMERHMNDSEAVVPQR
jgi:cytochrome o ubiquinol oxidase operon protein cyoD